MEKYFKVIKDEQQEDGSFLNHKGQKCVFCTAVIVLVLNHIDSAESIKIRKKAVEFFLSVNSESWRFSEEVGVNFLVLIAISGYDSKILDGVAIAKILMDLVSVEIDEGGPYFSNYKKKKEDNLIDLGVNVVVAYFLHLQNVNLPELDNLIEKAIRSSNYKTKLFSSELFLLFLLTRFYKSKSSAKLELYIESKYGDCFQLNFFDSLCVYLSLEKLNSKKGVGKKFGIDSDLYLSNSYPLYSETLSGDTFLSTISLNTAFYLLREEVSGENKKDKKSVIEGSGANFSKEEKVILNIILDIAERRFSKLNDSMQQIALQEIRNTIARNSDKQMSMISYYFRSALGEKGSKFSDNYVAKLGLANIFFWTSFIIYDDFWDEEGEPQKLPTANLYARSFTKFFNSIFPNDKGFVVYFGELMDRLDESNTWETVFCRALVKDDLLRIPEKLPDYGNYDFVYYPSSAHILGPVSMLYTLGYSLKSSEVKSLESYFKGVLVGMQFNDDMHDWEKDLRRGHLSVVVVMLLKDYKSKFPEKNYIDLEKDIKDLQEIFWLHTMPKACNIALEHIELSRQYLLKMKSIKSHDDLDFILLSIEKTLKTAKNKHSESLKIINRI